jgi:phospholipid/cholesterol/gamma-HCH transport system substrate-binding protein
VEPDAKYTYVGLAVIALVAMTVAVGVWFAKVGSKDATTYYKVYFQRHSLAGLKQDADVTMKGIKVGSVRSLRISADNIERVGVVLEVARDLPIKETTRAVIDRNLLTGLASVDLTGGTHDSPPLRDTKEEPYPLIPEGSPKLEKLQKSIPAVLEQIDKLLTKANHFLSDENQESLSRTLTHLESLSGTLAERDDELLLHMTKTAEAAATLTTSVEKRLEEISASLRGSSDALLFEISTVARDFSAVLREFSATLERYKDPRAIILGPGRDALGPGERALTERP